MKEKVLLLQGTLSLYNVPLYKVLAEGVDLTVAYTVKNECEEKVFFKVKQLKYSNVYGLFFMKSGFWKFCSEFDVVIFMPDLHYISYCLLPFVHRRYKVIPWTIGLRASYTRPYDVKRKQYFIDKIYGKVLNQSDAIIFYMKAPLKFWGKSIDKNKVFIAHNTVEVLKNEIIECKVRNRILFIGTLYKAKNIYELIDAYIQAKTICNSENFLCLDIIGKGEEYENIKAIIEEGKLTDFIFLHGPVYEEKKIAEFFSTSLLCISPDQAGLSVLKSMGYGVPYVTKHDAITGGERLNIINNTNGLLYNNQEELVAIIVKAFNEPEKFIDLGNAAQIYYNSNTTINHMAQGFLDAIEFVMK